MVFQQGALFPHLDVAGNVGFGAARARARRRDARARRPRPPREGLPARALGRRAPAGRAGPRAGRRPRGDPARRAVRRARRRPARGAARRRSPRSCAPRAPARCSSPTTRPRRCRSPTRSPCCATGAWSRPARPRRSTTARSSRWVAEFLGEADVLPGTAERRHRALRARPLPGRERAERRGAGRDPARVGGDRPRRRRGARRAEARRARALVLRPRPARAPRAALSGLRLRSRRLGFPAWHPGDRVRVWLDGPVNALAAERLRSRSRPAPRGRARRCRRRTAARRRSSCRCG